MSDPDLGNVGTTNMRPNLGLDSAQGTMDLPPKSGAHQPTLMSDLAAQDLLGRLDAMDELAAQS